MARQTTPSFLAPGPTAGHADAAPPQNAETPSSGGNRHAIQDDRPGADPAATGALRTAPLQQAAVAGDGRLCGRAEGQPRGVARPARPDTVGQPEPDNGRSAGVGDPGPAGPFALRIADGR